MPLIDASQTYQMTNLGAHIDGTDVYQTNPNLLDNAYFVGGGSQLGDGVFPINQRGLTSYSSVGYGIDRWRGETGYASVALAVDGLKFCSSTSGQWGTMVQILRKEASIAGKTVTISAIIDGTLASTTYSIPASGGYDLTPATVGDIAFNLYSPNGTDIQFRFYTTTATAHTIAAAKLELGTVSTLPNDAPPVFSEELAKCQHYLRYIPFVRVASPLEGTVASISLLGMPMRGVPTPSLVSSGGVLDGYSLISITGATVVGYAYQTVVVQFALASAASSTLGYIYDTVLCLSAEL